MTVTIVDKLKLQKYERVAVLGVPDGYTELSVLPNYDTALTGEQYDLIFAYVLSLDELKELIHRVIEEGRLAKGGYMYTAYPKKGNKVYSTFIHRRNQKKVETKTGFIT